MKIVSEQECLDWLNIKLDCNFTWEAIKTAHPYCATYLLPTDTGAKTAIARILSGSIDTRELGLFWFTAWGIFPTVQNMLLFDGYRKSLGESRPIHAAPGHIFGKSDLQSVECLLDLALYFYWDATLFEGTGSVVVTTSHDEWFSICACDKTHLKRVESKLENLDLRQVPRPPFRGWHR